MIKDVIMREMEAQGQGVFTELFRIFVSPLGHTVPMPPTKEPAAPFAPLEQFTH
jgi:hypothetical protein